MFCSLQDRLPLEVNVSGVTVGSAMKQVTGDIRYALMSLPPLTSCAWWSEKGFSEEVQAGGEAWVLMLFLPCQIPFNVIVGLHKVRDESEASWSL